MYNKVSNDAQKGVSRLSQTAQSQLATTNSRALKELLQIRESVKSLVTISSDTAVASLKKIASSIKGLSQIYTTPKNQTSFQKAAQKSVLKVTDLAQKQFVSSSKEARKEILKTAATAKDELAKIFNIRGYERILSSQTATAHRILATHRGMISRVQLDSFKSFKINVLDLNTRLVKTLETTSRKTSVIYRIHWKNYLDSITQSSKQTIQIANLVNRQTTKNITDNIQKTKTILKNFFNTTKRELSIFHQAAGAGLKNSFAQLAKSASTSIMGVTKAFHVLAVPIALIGYNLSQSENAFKKWSGYVLVALAAILGSISLIVIKTLEFVGEGLVFLGESFAKMSNKFKEAYKEFEKASYGFEFIVSNLVSLYGDAVGSLERWEKKVTDISRATAYSQKDIKAATAEALLLGKSFGFSAEQIETMLDLSVDLGAVLGETMLDSTLALSAALQGQSQSVQKYGLHLNTAYLANSKLNDELGVNFDRLSDSEKAQFRLMSAMRQSEPIRGKAISQLNTLSGIEEKIQKNLNDTMAFMGEAAFFTRVWKNALMSLTSSIAEMNKEILVAIGGFVDFGGVVFTVLGYFLKYIIKVGTLIFLLNILKIGFTALNSYIIASTAAQAALTSISSKLGLALGVQTIAVTSLSTAYRNLVILGRGMLFKFFKELLVYLKMVVVGITKVTIAVLKNPLFWKITVIIAAIYLVTKTIQRLEERTAVFANLLNNLSRIWKGHNEIIDETSKKYSVLDLFIGSVMNTFTIFVTAVANGISTIIQVFLNLFKVLLEFTDFLMFFGDVFDGLTKKLEDTSRAVTEMQKVLGEEMAKAFESLISGSSAFANEMEYSNEKTKDFVTLNQEAKNSLYELEKALIYAENSGNQYAANLIKISLAQERLNETLASKDRDIEAVEQAKLDLLSAQLDNAKAIKVAFEDTTKSAVTLRKELYHASDSIKDIKTNAAIEIKVETTEIDKEIKHLESLADRTLEHNELLESLYQEQALIKTKINEEALEKINTLHEEAAEERVELLEDEQEKIVHSYRKRFDELQKTLNNGYHTEKQYAAMVDALYELQTKELLESLDIRSKKTIETLEKAKAKIKELRQQELIDIKANAQAMQQIDQKQLDLLKDKQNKSIAATGDVLLEARQKLTGVLKGVFSDVDLDIDPTNFKNSLRSIERGAKSLDKNLRKKVDDISYNFSKKLQTMREQNIIDLPEQAKLLVELEDITKDITNNIDSDMENFLTEYGNKLKDTFDDTNSGVDDSSKVIEDKINKLKALLAGLGEGAIIDIEANLNNLDNLEETKSVDERVKEKEKQLHAADRRDDVKKVTDEALNAFTGGADWIFDTIFAGLEEQKEQIVRAFDESTDSYHEKAIKTRKHLGMRLGKDFTNMMQGNEVQMSKFFANSLNYMGSYIGQLRVLFTKGLLTMWQEGGYTFGKVIKVLGGTKDEINKMIYGLTDHFMEMLDNIVENLPYMFRIIADKIPVMIEKVVALVFTPKLWVAVFESIYDAMVIFIWRTIQLFIIAPINSVWNHTVNFIKNYGFLLMQQLTAMLLIFLGLFTNFYDNIIKKFNLSMSASLMKTISIVAGSFISLISLYANWATFADLWENLIKKPFFDLIRWLTGSFDRLASDLNEYEKDDKKEEEDNIKKLQEYEKALESYLGKYGDAEFRIKDVAELDEKNRMQAYAEGLEKDLDKTTNTFATSLGDKTYDSLSASISSAISDSSTNIQLQTAQRYAGGGFVSGSVKGKKDALAHDVIPAMLSAGEYVIPKSIAQDDEKMQQILAIMSNNKMAAGGFTDKQASVILRQQQSRYATLKQTMQPAALPAAAALPAKTTTKAAEYGAFGDKSLPDILKDLPKNFIDALKKGIVSIADMLKKAFTSSINKISDFFSKKNLQSIGESLKGTFTSVVNSIDSFFSEKNLKSLGLKIKDAFSWNNIVETFDAMKNDLSTIATWTSSFFESILVAFGAFISELWSGVDTTLKNVFSSVGLDKLLGEKTTDAVAGAGATVVSSGISSFLAALMILGVAAAATAIKIVAVETALAGKKGLNLALDTAKIAIESIGDAGKKGAKGVKDFVIGIPSFVAGIYASAAAVLSTIPVWGWIVIAVVAVVAVVGIFITYWEEMKTLFEDAIIWLSDFFDPLFDFLAKSSAGIKKLWNTFMSAWNFINNFFNLGEFFKQAFFDIGFVVLEGVKKVVAFVVAGFTSLFQFLIPFSSFLYEHIIKPLFDLFPVMSAKVLELFKSMFNILASIFTIENVKVVFDKVLSAMKLVFAWENLKPPFDAIIAAIKSIFNWSGLSILFANIAAGIRKIFSWNNFKGVFSGVFAGIKSILDKLNPVNAAKKVGGWLGFSQGGFVDGKAHFSGDNAKNDNIPAMLSAGEYVIPRSIAQNKNIMQQILALIENGGMIPAFQGYPTDLNLGKPTKIDMPSK